MRWSLYSVSNDTGKIYYGQTQDIEERWKQHNRKKEGVVKELLDEGKCELKILENFDTYEEARLTEALAIEMLPCVNKRSELLDVVIDKKEYGKLYRGYRDEVFNKKGKCKFCGVVMIDRNLKRHYGRCGILTTK